MNIFISFLLMSLTKFLLEDKLLITLMVMESISILMFFIILSFNLLAMGLGSSLLSFLTIQISDSVLGLCFFVNMMRMSKSDKVSSHMMLKL